MVPHVITNYSHQDVPHYLQPFSSASLHDAHIFLILFHFSTIYLLLIEAFRFFEYPG